MVSFVYHLSNVAEVWCCSEHYLWLLDGDFYLDPLTAVYCCCAVVSEDAKTTLASGQQTLSLEGGHTQCQSVLEHGLNLHRNIPLNHNICARKQLSFFLIWRKKTLSCLTLCDLRKRSSSSLGEGGRCA